MRNAMRATHDVVAIDVRRQGVVARARPTRQLQTGWIRIVLRAATCGRIGTAKAALDAHELVLGGLRPWAGTCESVQRRWQQRQIESRIKRHGRDITYIYITHVT